MNSCCSLFILCVQKNLGVRAPLAPKCIWRQPGFAGNLQRSPVDRPLTGLRHWQKGKGTGREGRKWKGKEGKGERKKKRAGPGRGRKVEEYTPCCKILRVLMQTTRLKRTKNRTCSELLLVRFDATHWRFLAVSFWFAMLMQSRLLTSSCVFVTWAYSIRVRY